MDVKRMHDMIEKLSECAKAELDKGTENLNVLQDSNEHYGRI